MWLMCLTQTFMDEDRSVIVSNIPEDLKDVVEAYLDSERKGGGMIQSFDYDNTTQSAVVVFESVTGEFN